MSDKYMQTAKEWFCSLSPCEHDRACEGPMQAAALFADWLDAKREAATCEWCGSTIIVCERCGRRIVEKENKDER